MNAGFILVFNTPENSDDKNPLYLCAETEKQKHSKPPTINLII